MIDVALTLTTVTTRDDFHEADEPVADVEAAYDAATERGTTARPRRWTDYVPLAEVVRAPRNPKGHNAEMIAASVSRFGVVETPAVDERTGRLVAGHGRLDDWQARKAAGEDPPDGIDVSPDGDWLVPVQRGWASRSDADAEAYLVVSNQSTIVGGWDDEGLAQLLADLRDQDPDLLALTGFDDKWISQHWEGDANPWDFAGDIDDDVGVDPPEEPVSRLGDVWILGRHRLLCGSAIDSADVDLALAGATPAVVYADPPYGVSIVGKDGKVGDKVGTPGRGLTGSGKIIKTTMFRPIVNDDTTATAVAAFRLAYDRWPSAVHGWWGANYYTADAALPNSPGWLLWDKENGTTDFADAEMCWTNRKAPVRMFRHQWQGMMRASERGSLRVHPTQKPVALAVWALDLLDKAGGGLVFDGFGGSGSTLLAAEKTGRPAVLLELDPGYCDVICRRFQAATGVLPVREADGETVSFQDGEA